MPPPPPAAAARGHQPATQPPEWAPLSPRLRKPPHLTAPPLPSLPPRSWPPAYHRDCPGAQPRPAAQGGHGGGPHAGRPHPGQRHVRLHLHCFSFVPKASWRAFQEPCLFIGGMEHPPVGRRRTCPARHSAWPCMLSHALSGSRVTAVHCPLRHPCRFCYQCEQTARGTGCTTVGVCGKTPETTYLQARHRGGNVAANVAASSVLGGTWSKAAL